MEQKEIKKAIDYIKIVDQLNDEAFNFCIDHIYRYINYQVLKKADIRRIDLEEWLLKFNDTVSEYREGRERGSLNFYMFLLKLYMTDSLRIYPKSNADQYRKRALALIDTILYDDFVTEDIDDVFLIFTGLFRLQKNDISKSKIHYLKESIDFTLVRHDAGLLEEIRTDSENYEPKEIIASKSRIFPLKADQIVTKQKAKDFMYINNILFLSRGLQKQGVFYRRSDNGRFCCIENAGQSICR